VWCWGLNNYGQIGTPDWQGEGGGPSDTRPRALKVSAGALLFRHLGAGGEHTCASSTEPGEPIYCWGRNNLGQLGWSPSMDSTPQPTPVVVLDGGTGAALPGAAAVGAGNRFSCAGTYANAIHPEPGLWCWGQNARHALGDDSDPGQEDGLTRWTAVPVELALFSPVTRVDGGNRFACAVLQNGQLWCWGSADGGELGTETASLWLGPTLVLDDGLDVTAGFDHACAITSDYRVLCWGDNDSGQLGDGTQIERHAPTEVGAMCP
jgi:alpha-tubulin suppressor-like RCC1 family protein